MNVEFSRTSLRRAAQGLVGALASLLVACASDGGRLNPQNTYVGKEGGVEIDEQIGDPSLERHFVLVGLLTERRDGRLHVQFDLKNTATSELSVEWSIEWMDGRGFRIDTQPHWRPARVGGNGVVPVQETAPVPEAATFKLHVRRSSPVR